MALKRKHQAALLIAVLSALAGVCLAAWVHWRVPPGGLKTESRRAGVPAESVTLAYVATTHSVLAGIALQRGYYLQEGLQVIPRQHSFGKAALDDLLQGNADFATVADPPIMLEVMKGGRICVVATIQTSNRDNAIVARTDSGIRVPADLKGRKIAVARGTTSDFFVDAFLVANGIYWKEVHQIDATPQQWDDALTQGRVEAVSAFQPFLAKLQRKWGERALSFYDESIYTWTFNIVAQQEYARRNPQTVKSLLRALIKAEEFVARNQAQAQRIVAEYSGVDIDLVRQIWSGTRFAVTLDQFLVLALEDESRWAINTGMIGPREIPDYLDYLYFEGLEAVNPSAVRILGR